MNDQSKHGSFARRTNARSNNRANGGGRDNTLDFGELDEFVGFQLHRARNVAATRIHDLIAPEFQPGHFPILYLIGRNPGQTQSAIARAVGLDRSSLVPILNRFEQAGWVQRVPSEGDRRAHALRLTRAGERKLEDLHATVTSLEERISGELGEEGHKVMLEMLHKIQETLDRPS